MAREMKVGLLIGVGMILLMGIIISDYLSVKPKATPTAAWTNFGKNAQQSIYADPSDAQADTHAGGGTGQVNQSDAGGVSGAGRFADQPLPTPRELQQGFGQTPPHASGQTPHAASPQRSPGAGGGDHNQAVSVMELDGSTHGRASASSRTPATSSVQIPSHQPRIPDHLNRGATQQLAAGDAQQPLRKRVSVQHAVAATTGDIIHEVKSGESLYQIARHYYNNGAYWKSIRDANPNKVTSDGQVKTGTKLVIPNRAGLANTAGGHGASSVVMKAAGGGTVAGGVTGGRPTVSQAGRKIAVQSGDTLSSLAHHYLGSASKWHELLAANKEQLNGKATNLRAGMTLTLPAAGANAIATGSRSAFTHRTSGAHSPSAAQPVSQISHYTVKPGDNLIKIARQTLGSGAKWKAIYNANRSTIKTPTSVPAGAVLTIPHS